MLALLLAYLGGILTILSPCILPVLPFVFARADRPFLTNGLPMLIGMAATFALVASLAAVGGEAALAANAAGRWIALALFASFALLLIFPSLSTRAMQPLVRLGERLSGDGPNSANASSGLGGSLLLGAATGLLWAPCAGPILGLILTGAAVGGASASTALLLLAYALGAATSLALALLVGGRAFAAMKRSIGAGERVRKALGVLILAAVAVIALGLDTRLLAPLSSGSTFSLEQSLAARLGMGKDVPRTSNAALADEGPFPGLDGATLWLNGRPLTAADLKGKVVLVDFWTYSCINCIRAIPHIRALHDRYAKDGLVIVGVHTPEFAFERDSANVRKAIADQSIAYPVALDNDRTIWRAFDNHYWPATYIADANGRLRYHHFGEGGEAATENAVRRLLMERGARLGAAATDVASDARTLASETRGRSPETYLGTERAARFAVRAGRTLYPAPGALAVNGWALTGDWSGEPQRSVTAAANAAIAFVFKGRDVHLVLGSKAPTGFTVTLDGKAPGANHGVDIDAAGRGRVDGQRLYNLIRLEKGIGPHRVEIRFDATGVEAYAFTFG